MVFVKSHIPSRKLTEFKVSSNVQVRAFEINFQNKKWLVVSIYWYPSHDNKYFLLHLTNITKHTTKWIIILGGFNSW